MEWQKTKCTSRALLECFGSMKKGKDEWWKPQAAEIQLQGTVGTYVSAKEVVRNIGRMVGAKGPAVAEEREGWERRNLKKTQSKWQRGHTHRNVKNSRKDEGSLERPKDAESCAGIRKEMPWPGAGRWVRPAGGGCQILQKRWMRWEKKTWGQPAEPAEGGHASSQHERTAEGQLDR